MFFLGLNANAIWLLHVATNDGPHDTNGEDESSEITNKYVALVHATVEELQ